MVRRQNKGSGGRACKVSGSCRALGSLEASRWLLWKAAGGGAQAPAASLCTCGLVGAMGLSSTLLSNTRGSGASGEERWSEVTQISTRSHTQGSFYDGAVAIAPQDHLGPPQRHGRVQNMPHPARTGQASSTQHSPNAGAAWASSLLVFPRAWCRVPGLRGQGERGGAAVPEAPGEQGVLAWKSSWERLLCLGVGSAQGVAWCVLLSQRHSWQAQLSAYQRRSQCRSGCG